MNYDSLSHIPARTRTAGIRDKGRSSKRCFMLDKGPTCRCPGCGGNVYVRGVQNEKCLKCRMNPEHQSPLERAIEILASRMEGVK